MDRKKISTKEKFKQKTKQKRKKGVSIAFMQVASQIALHVNGMRKCVLGRNNTKKDLRMHALVDKKY